MKGVISFAVSLTLCGLLSACGDTELGAGDDDDGGGTNGIPKDPAPLTENGAEDAAGLVAISMEQTSDAKDLAFDNLESITDTALSTARRALAAIPRTVPADTQFTFSGASGTIYCGANPSTDTGNGQLDWVFNDGDDDGDLESPDSVSLTWVNCEVGATEIDGKLVISNYSASGADDLESGNGSVGFRAAFDEWRIDTNTTPGLVTLDGSVTYSLTSSNGVITTNTESESLIIGADSRELEFIDYNSSTEYTVATTAYNTEIVAEIASEDLGGAVTITTPTAIAGQLNVSSGRPSSGVIEIEGDDSSLTVTIESVSAIEIGVDANGDGTIDTEVNTTWADIIDEASD